MKILLISPSQDLHKGIPIKPSFGTQPLGIAYIASSLRNEGHDVSLLDAYTLGLEEEGIKRHVFDFKPDIVGLTAVTVLARDAYYVAKLTKEIDSKIITVIGGPHAFAVPEDCLKQKDIDLVVLGEGEKTLCDLCKLELNKRNIADILTELPSGIAVRSNGDIYKTGLSQFITDLDSLPFPSHDLLLPIEMYNPYPHWGKKGKYSALITSRGCPYSCMYCSISRQQGHLYRKRSPENVVDEIEWLNNEYGASTFSFRDGTFTLDKKRVVKICELIKDRQIKIAWNCTGVVNEVDKELLRVMKEAGCKCIQYGIEVGNEQMLKSIKRKTPEQVRNAIRITKEMGIDAHGYFMFGLPGETKETAEETIQFAKSLDLSSAGFTTATPYPGTEFWDKVEDKLLHKEWEKYNVKSFPVFENDNLNYNELLKIQKKAYRAFFLRPIIAINLIIRLVKTPTDLRNIIIRSIKSFF